MAFWQWSKTAADNATADSSINWAEGQAPSSVNDSARAMMAASAKYRDDIAGGTVTGGTATAYTLTSNQTFDTLAHMHGAMIAFTPHTTSGDLPTLNVDGLGAKLIRILQGYPMPAGVLLPGTPYVAIYNNNDGTGAFYLKNFLNLPWQMPIGAGMDYWGSTTPNSNFAFPAGQAISRTTYSLLYGIIGTIYGAGDGSTTFNLPDKTGRVAAMREASSAFLSTTYFGGDSTVLGSKGGGEATGLVLANLPPYTPSGSIANGAITINRLGATLAGNATSSAVAAAGVELITSSQSISFSATQAASSFTGTAQGGSNTSFRTVQPTIICNYIMRII